MVKTARKACQDTHIDSLCNTAATGLKANMADERQFLGKWKKYREADEVEEGWCKFQKFVNEFAMKLQEFNEYVEQKIQGHLLRPRMKTKEYSKIWNTFLLSHANGTKWYTKKTRK